MGKKRKEAAAAAAPLAESSERSSKRAKKDALHSVLTWLDTELRALGGAEIDARGITLTPPCPCAPAVRFPADFDLHFVGSHAHKTRLSDAAVDIAMLVDFDSVFLSHDRLDYKYFWKKQLLMAFLAQRLHFKCMDGFGAVYSFSRDDTSVHFTIQLGIRSPGSAKVHQLSPARSNIRTMLFQGTRSGMEANMGANTGANMEANTGANMEANTGANMEANTGANMEANTGTGHYNSLIMRDFNCKALNDHVTKSLRGNAAAIECLKLLKAWHRKMDFAQHIGMIDSFSLGVLFCHWLQSNSLVHDCDAMVVLRGFLSFLAMNQWTEAVVLGKYDSAALPPDHKHAFSKGAFWSAFDVVLVDPSGTLNVLSHATVAGMKTFSHFSKQLLDCLSTTIPCSLKTLLVEKSSSLMLYDFSILVDTLGGQLTDVEHLRSVDPVECQAVKAVKVIGKALVERVEVCTAERLSGSKFRILLKVNLGKCFGLVDFGPSPGDKEQVSEFQRLWGSRAELRKFESGAVQWAAAWPELASKRHSILPSAVCHLLRHHQVSTRQSVVCEQLDFLLDATGVSLKPFSYFLDSFEQLAKVIRGTTKLPLGIVQIVPVADCLRYTAVFPSLVEARVAGRASPVVDALLIFERTSKWPDDLQALKCAKHAFLIQLLRVLENDHGIPCSVESTNDFLDVFFKSIVFRFRIRVEKEMLLLKKEGMLAEHTCLRHLNDEQPLFHATIHDLCTKNPVFGPTVRMVKRWCASQMFSFIKDDLLELLCGVVFGGKSLGSVPGSLVSGFHRVLAFISEHRHDAPIVWDIDGALSEDTLRDIHKDASMTVYCSFLKHGRYHVTVPTGTEWRLLQRVAKATLLLLEDPECCYSELLNPVLVESGVLRPYRISPVYSNSVLCNRSKRPAELVDRTVRKAAGPQSDFVKSLPGLVLIEAVAGRVASEHHTTCFYDKYTGTMAAVFKDAPDIPELSAFN